jgi:hypothetical protein
MLFRSIYSAIASHRSRRYEERILRFIRARVINVYLQVLVETEFSLIRAIYVNKENSVLALVP